MCGNCDKAITPLLIQQCLFVFIKLHCWDTNSYACLNWKLYKRTYVLMIIGLFMISLKINETILFGLSNQVYIICNCFIYGESSISWKHYCWGDCWYFAVIIACLCCLRTFSISLLLISFSSFVFQRWHRKIVTDHLSYHRAYIFIWTNYLHVKVCTYDI